MILLWLMFAPMAIDVNGLLTTALSIVAIATLAGLGLLRGTVTNLRDNLKDARDEITDKDRRLLEAEKTIATQKADLEATQRLAMREDKIDALSAKFDKRMFEIKDMIRGTQK